MRPGACRATGPVSGIKYHRGTGVARRIHAVLLFRAMIILYIDDFMARAFLRTIMRFVRMRWVMIIGPWVIRRIKNPAGITRVIVARIVAPIH